MRDEGGVEEGRWRWRWRCASAAIRETREGAENKDAVHAVHAGLHDTNDRRGHGNCEGVLAWLNAAMGEEIRGRWRRRECWR